MQKTETINGMRQISPALMHGLQQAADALVADLMAEDDNIEKRIIE